MANLHAAANQWQTRPADERYWSVTDCLAAARAQEAASVSATLPVSAMRVYAEDGAIKVNGRTESAVTTHYSFGQLCQHAKAPAGYLRSLPAELAANCLQRSLADNRDDAEDSRLLLYRNGQLTLRAINGPQYTRIFDGDILDRCVELSDRGWVTPPARPAGQDSRTRPATEADIIPIGSGGGAKVAVGDMIAPAGVYRGDRDMFVFMIDPTRPIEVNGAVLHRGFFLWNSEVGDKSVGMTIFLFDGVCGNHILWSAQVLGDIRMRHVGSVDRRWTWEASRHLSKWQNAGTDGMVASIRRAQGFALGVNRDEVIDRVANLKSLALTRTVVGQAYDAAKRTPRYGSPASAWGLAQGLTEVSQGEAHTENRVKLDRAAGKIIEIAF